MALHPGLVDRWQHHYGIAGSQPMAFRGDEGLAALHGLTKMSAAEPKDFDARVCFAMVEEIATVAMLHTPYTATRTPDRIAADGEDSLVLGGAVLNGSIRVRQGGRETRLARNQMTVLSTRQPYEMRAFSVSDTAILRLPISSLGSQGRLVKDLAARPLPDTILTRSATSYLTRFVYEVAVSGPTRQAHDAVPATLDLIKSLLSQLGDEQRVLADRSLYHREAARDLIERHHTDPDFSVDVLASRLNISRRQLYRYFASEEHQISEYLTWRRLQTARSLISENPAMLISEVSMRSGIANPATLRNQFSSRYGETPSEFRDRCAQWT